MGKSAPFKTFLGCMSLQTGCIIIGLSELLYCIIMMGSKQSFVFAINLVCSAALLIGILKNNRNYFWLWIVWNCIQIVALTLLLSLAVLYATVLLQMDSLNSYYTRNHWDIEKINKEVSIAIPLFIVFILVSAFLAAIVYSHFVELREKEKREQAVIPSAPMVWRRTTWIRNYFDNTVTIQFTHSLCQSIFNKLHLFQWELKIYSKSIVFDLFYW